MDLLGRIVPLLPVFVFATFVTGFCVVRGMCCADDGYFAVVAKNLANGNGYASSFQPSDVFRLFEFDPWISSGPTLILPASLFIFLFGNAWWVPGVAHVVTWATVAGSFLTRLAASIPRISVAAFACVFFALNYVWMTWHFAHWFALLGEITAALLIILAFTLLCQDPQSRRRAFVSGVVLGLAALAKTLALAGLPVLIIWTIVYFWRKPRSGYQQALLVVAGFACPLLLFESWKFLSLGIIDYRANWALFLKFLTNKGVREPDSASLLTQLLSRDETLTSQFRVTLVELFLACTLAALLVLRSRNDVARRWFCGLSSIAILYTLWWVFFSIGWPRYYIIALVLIAALVASPILVLRRLPAHAIYLAVLVILSVRTWPQLDTPMSDGWFRPSTRTRNCIQTADYLQQQCAGKPVITYSWHAISDLQYYSDNPVMFTPWKPSVDIGEPRLLAYNKKFLFSKNDERFALFLDRYGTLVFSADPYYVYRVTAEAGAGASKLSTGDDSQ
jgi:predicted nucleic acid binding AN1-type Zn finger protein